MKKLLLLAFCFGMLFTSCSDDDGKIDNTVDKTYSANKFIGEQKDNAKQTFDLNTSDLPKTISLGNIEITIPEGAFTKNGTPISGAFTLEAYEMMTPSSIILSGTNTNYRGGMYGAQGYFISDGFFYIDAKQNGVSVDKDLAAGKFLDITVPANDAGDRWETQIWQGADTISSNTGDQFGWIDPDLEDIEVWNSDRKENTIWKGNDGFQFGFGKLGWCNCDIFWNDGPMTTVKVSLTGNVGELASYMGGSGDTFVFFLGRGYRTVVQLYSKIDDNTVASYDNSMPVGAKGKMLAFSIKEGIFSFASQDITIEENMHLTLDLKEVTKDKLLSEIKSLDTYK
jgi:hypothetical protein